MKRTITISISIITSIIVVFGAIATILSVFFKIPLLPQPEYAMPVTVKSGNTLRPNVQVIIYDENNKVVDAGFTNAHGNFVFAKLKSGNYFYSANGEYPPIAIYVGDKNTIFPVVIDIAPEKIDNTDKVNNSTSSGALPSTDGITITNIPVNDKLLPAHLSGGHQLSSGKQLSRQRLVYSVDGPQRKLQSTVAERSENYLADPNAFFASTPRGGEHNVLPENHKTGSVQDVGTLISREYLDRHQNNTYLDIHSYDTIYTSRSFERIHRELRYTQDGNGILLKEEIVRSGIEDVKQRKAGTRKRSNRVLYRQQ